MSTLPLVSIVIPVYNGANYLAQAIDSALAQTWPHCEVLVVNDGSRDDGATERIARGYGERIRYIAKENGGVASALNVGIREMRGEYFSWLSHDDLYHPQKVARLVEFHRQQTGDVLVLCDSLLVDEQGTPLRQVPLADGLLADPVLLALSGAIDGCALLVPAVAFARVGPFDEALRTTQDIELWLRLAKGGYRFLRLPEALSYSRVHDAQTTHSVGAAHRQACSRFYREAVAGLEQDYLAQSWRPLATMLCEHGEAPALELLLGRCQRHAGVGERQALLWRCRFGLLLREARGALRRQTRRWRQA